MFNAFLGIKILDDNNLITELKNRGYDISTIKFEITKKNSEIQPLTTKDLTLDMWDKSVVNKIKRLEKSVELNNKIKRELKQQLDQANERLKGLPKFGIGQKVYYVRDTTFPIEIDEIQSKQGNFFYVDYTYNEIFKESELVATREEAQELRGGE